MRLPAGRQGLRNGKGHFRDKIRRRGDEEMSRHFGMRNVNTIKNHPIQLNPVLMALSLFNTLESIATPCSVKTYNILRSFDGLPFIPLFLSAAMNGPDPLPDPLLTHRGKFLILLPSKCLPAHVVKKTATGC